MKVIENKALSLGAGNADPFSCPGISLTKQFIRGVGRHHLNLTVQPPRKSTLKQKVPRSTVYKEAFLFLPLVNPSS